MSAQRPNLPYQSGPKNQNYERNYNAPGRDNFNAASGRDSLRQPYYGHNQQHTDAGPYGRMPYGGAYQYPDEVGRNPQHTGSSEFTGGTPSKHFVNSTELHGPPVTVPGFANTSAAPQWMMHPSSEHNMLPQVGSLPVSSFSSSRGSPDSSDYGSGPASNADLSAGDMLSGRESQVSDNDQSGLKGRVQYQIEYYFSPLNLAKDLYLRSQMDGDNYVLVALIAGFNCVRRLTQDLHFITDAIRASTKLELDESGTKVRPRSNRSTVVIHDLPETVTKEDLVALFAKQIAVKPVHYECADKTCWYVEFEEEDEAKEALRYLREDAREFSGKPICARIRALPVAVTSVFKGVDGSHPGPGTVGVSPMSDDSVQQMTRTTGDLVTQAHQFPVYPAFPASNNQYFPQPVNHQHINPSMLVWPPQIPGMSYVDMLNMMAMSGMYPMGPSQPQQSVGPPVYRASGPPVNTRGGRGGRRGNGGNPNYTGGANRRGGRGESYPNSGRNSAMSDSRPEQNHSAAHAHNQNSRHGSFSSPNGVVHGVLSPTDTRSGSSTPPVHPDSRGRTNSGSAADSDRRSSALLDRKAKPKSDLQNANEASLPLEQPDIVKEPQAKFDFEPQMFPPLPGQSSADAGEQSGGPQSHSNPTSQSANVSAADVVRGVSNVKIAHYSNAKAWPDNDFAHPDDHGRVHAHHSEQTTSGHHLTETLRKKEQASSTDDLPKSGRDHGELKVRMETAPERPRVNSSAGTQTAAIGSSAISAQQAGISSREDTKFSSPKKIPQQHDQTASGVPVGDGQRGGNISGTRASSSTEHKIALEAEAGVDSASAKGGVGETGGKGTTISYASIAQMNRDKLPVSGTGPGSATSGSGGSKALLTKQSSLDSSSQDDKRSLVEKESSTRSKPAAREVGSGNARFARLSNTNANGHDSVAVPHTYTNGTGQAGKDDVLDSMSHVEPVDNEGFTEVTKHHHKYPHHHRAERNFRANGVARHGAPME